MAYGNIAASVAGNVADAEADPTIDLEETLPGEGVLYAKPPVEYFDFPKDVFEGDGNYTIKVWAENDDDTRISPLTSILLSVQQNADSGRPGDPDADPPVDAVGSLFQGYETGNSFRTFAGTATDGVILAVWGLSIQDN